MNRIPAEAFTTPPALEALAGTPPRRRNVLTSEWALVSLERLTKQFDALFDVSFPPGAMEREGS